MKNIVDVTLVSLVSGTIIIGTVLLIKKIGTLLNKGNSNINSIVLVIATILAIVSISLYYKP